MNREELVESLETLDYEPYLQSYQEAVADWIIKNVKIDRLKTSIILQQKVKRKDILPKGCVDVLDLMTCNKIARAVAQLPLVIKKDKE